MFFITTSLIIMLMTSLQVHVIGFFQVLQKIYSTIFFKFFMFFTPNCITEKQLSFVVECKFSNLFEKNC